MRSQRIRAATHTLQDAHQRADDLEKQFVEYKHDVHYRQQRADAEAMRICAIETALFEQEERISRLRAASRELEAATADAEKRVGWGAISRGRERRLVVNNSSRAHPAVASAAMDALLLRLPL